MISGTLLQGVYNVGETDTWRSSLQSDLIATASNHIVSGAADECISVVGDTSSCEVILQYVLQCSTYHGNTVILCEIQAGLR